MAGAAHVTRSQLQSCCCNMLCIPNRQMIRSLLWTLNVLLLGFLLDNYADTVYGRSRVSVTSIDLVEILGG
jgi:hypothetical protein